MQLPKLVKPADLTTEEEKIFSLLLGREGRLKSSKPEPKKGKDHTEEEKDIIGKSAYAWRMLCFFLGTRPQDRCMPVTCDFDIYAPADKNEWYCTNYDSKWESHSFEDRPKQADKTGFHFVCPNHPETAQHDRSSCYQTLTKGKWSGRKAREIAKSLDKGIVDKILKTTKPQIDPVAAYFGVTTGADAWANALGLKG
jgi:hypothetical protein